MELENFLDYNEAANFLKISVGTLRNWLSTSNPDKPKPPFHNKGRRIYFLASELHSWIISDTKQSKPTATAKVRAKQQTIKLTFTAEESQKLNEALLHKEIDPDAVADYCKKSILEAVQKVLDNASKS